jgi:hypothetical protein
MRKAPARRGWLASWNGSISPSVRAGDTLAFPREGQPRPDVCSVLANPDSPYGRTAAVQSGARRSAAHRDSRSLITPIEPSGHDCSGTRPALTRGGGETAGCTRQSGHETSASSASSGVVSCPPELQAVTAVSAPTTRQLLLVRSSHHIDRHLAVVGCCSRTNPATPGPSRPAAGSAQLAGCRAHADARGMG